MATARQIVLAARPQGKPQLTDFRFEETEIPRPASGQLLLAVQYLSLDRPDGIDVYFENVGGAVWQAVLPLLNTYARIPV
jgi:NADPH-dependent curcumin reductase CurA